MMSTRPNGTHSKNHRREQRKEHDRNAKKVNAKNNKSVINDEPNDKKLNEETLHEEDGDERLIELFFGHSSQSLGGTRITYP